VNAARTGLAKFADGGYTGVMNTTLSKEGRLRGFLKGFMSAFDLSGQSLISIPDLDSGFQQDYEAIKGDWIRVGDDMRRAMNIVTHEQ
jgi:hypothetical protein